MPGASDTSTFTRARDRVLLALVFAQLALRYWLSVFPRTAREIRRLRADAAEIPNPQLRHLALCSLEKRSNLEGAAAFAALVPRRHRRRTIRALVAFQSLYNYADLLAEQPGPECRQAAGRVHAAMLLALCPAATPPPGDSDPGAPERRYVSAQIEHCRRALATLPSIGLVRAQAQLAASGIWSFQTHSSRNPAQFEAWARQLPRSEPALAWWESAGAAGSSLSIYALIAAASSPRLDPGGVARILSAYAGTIGALHSLLDSLTDETEDALDGQPSLIGLYPSRLVAARAIGALAERAMSAARALPDGRRHAVLTAAMASLYLSDPNARSAPAADVTAAVRHALGPVARPAIALLSARRRMAFPRRAATARLPDPAAEKPACA
jgi:tetraprenyl-beta-curcumene synthase